MKETRKEIVEQTRNAVARQYKAQIEELHNRIKRICEERRVESEKYNKLYAENEELKNKVAEYEDWNNRLLEFMDMPEEKRKEAYLTYKANLEVNEKLQSTLNYFSKFFLF